jgi:hypothetical protein
MTRRIKILSVIWTAGLVAVLLLGPPGMDGLLPHAWVTVSPSTFVGLTVMVIAWGLLTPVMVVLWVVSFFRWAFTDTKPPARPRG